MATVSEVVERYTKTDNPTEKAITRNIVMWSAGTKTGELPEVPGQYHRVDATAADQMPQPTRAELVEYARRLFVGVTAKTWNGELIPVAVVSQQPYVSLLDAADRAYQIHGVTPHHVLTALADMRRAGIPKSAAGALLCAYLVYGRRDHE